MAINSNASTVYEACGFGYTVHYQLLAAGDQPPDFGASKSDKPTRCNISLRTRSITAKATSAPSSEGSTWTLKGRLPKGVSTTLTIASTTVEASASGGTRAAKAFW